MHGINTHKHGINPGDTHASREPFNVNVVYEIAAYSLRVRINTRIFVAVTGTDAKEYCDAPSLASALRSTVTRVLSAPRIQCCTRTPRSSSVVCSTDLAVSVWGLLAQAVHA